MKHTIHHIETGRGSNNSPIEARLKTMGIKFSKTVIDENSCELIFDLDIKPAMIIMVDSNYYTKSDLEKVMRYSKEGKQRYNYARIAAYDGSRHGSTMFPYIGDANTLLYNYAWEPAKQIAMLAKLDIKPLEEAFSKRSIMITDSAVGIRDIPNNSVMWNTANYEALCVADEDFDALYWRMTSDGHSDLRYCALTADRLAEIWRTTKSIGAHNIYRKMVSSEYVTFHTSIQSVGVDTLESECRKYLADVFTPVFEKVFEKKQKELLLLEIWKRKFDDVTFTQMGSSSRA